MLSLLECTNISEKIFLDPKTLEECRLKPNSLPVIGNCLSHVC